ncbi:DUF2637 domain-containing protein [Streptomyces cylindrosporus]|uniref:DUF2637 domain-containing protein n=1 Tax=Streptomyces cylindrosporus TaxID=2927583 RepID=A0ABS9YG89_9ACTN|nr:DUF2637 domain-containing protein [Streptomyces cylindrosporus]MCI3276253.1 hypothetical protein [Streptomyces cylindrosporus]
MTTEALADPAAPEVPRRDWLLYAGMGAVGLAAAASSYAALQDLAVRTGWWPWLSWLLPLTTDAYAMTAVRVWLGHSTRNAKARAWAKANAIGAIVLSVAGNAVDHAIASHVIAMSWPLIVAVSAIPPVVLGLLVHMAHLRTQPPADTPATTPVQQTLPPAPTAPPPPNPPAPPAEPKRRQPRRPAVGTTKRQALPPGKSDEELIAAARERAATGQEPSATWLIKTYGIGTRRAGRIRDAALNTPAPAPDVVDTPAEEGELALTGGEA